MYITLVAYITCWLIASDISCLSPRQHSSHVCPWSIIKQPKFKETTFILTYGNDTVEWVSNFKCIWLNIYVYVCPLKATEKLQKPIVGTLFQITVIDVTRFSIFLSSFLLLKQSWTSKFLLATLCFSLISHHPCPHHPITSSLMIKPQLCLGLYLRCALSGLRPDGWNMIGQSCDFLQPWLFIRIALGALNTDAWALPTEILTWLV